VVLNQKLYFAKHVTMVKNRSLHYAVLIQESSEQARELPEPSTTLTYARNDIENPMLQ